MISTLEERLDNLARAGIDEAYLLPFDDSIAKLDAQTFLDKVVAQRVGARVLVVGENFRFGTGRGGDAEVARERMSALGIGFVAVAQLEDRGERISSTRIRRAIAGGDVALADELLGAPYTLHGRVVVGEGRGHDLGFPTANLDRTLRQADSGRRCLPMYRTLRRTRLRSSALDWDESDLRFRDAPHDRGLAARLRRHDLRRAT